MQSSDPLESSGLAAFTSAALPAAAPDRVVDTHDAAAGEPHALTAEQSDTQTRKRLRKHGPA